MPTTSQVPSPEATQTPAADADSWPSIQTRFSVGTTTDLLEGLRFAHEHSIEMPERHWGLKLLGYAVCARLLHDPRFARLLEAGVGFGDEMYRAFDGTGGDRELWTIDNEAFYTPEQVQRGRAARANCTNVDGLLGEFCAELPADHFDAVFSISALEHAPMETVRAICEDTFRVTAPGGVSVHTLDFAFDTIPARIEPWLSELQRAGFEVDEGGVDLTIGLTNAAGEAYLFEPVESVYTNWCKLRIDDGKPLPDFKTRHGAVVVVARKPG
ncbi:MAG: hypothetical protein ACI89L_000585 [Phycisphaerales bacterium]|jgi:hypothetical protein